MKVNFKMERKYYIEANVIKQLKQFMLNIKIIFEMRIQ